MRTRPTSTPDPSGNTSGPTPVDPRHAKATHPDDMPPGTARPAEVTLDAQIAEDEQQEWRRAGGDEPGPTPQPGAGA